MGGLVKTASLVMERGSRQRRSVSSTPIVCWGCGQPGHIQRECGRFPRHQGNDGGFSRRGQRGPTAPESTVSKRGTQQRRQEGGDLLPQGVAAAVFPSPVVVVGCTTVGDFCNVKVEGVECLALVDTGSTVRGTLERGNVCGFTTPRARRGGAQSWTVHGWGRVW